MNKNNPIRSLQWWRLKIDGIKHDVIIIFIYIMIVVNNKGKIKIYKS